MTGTGNGVSDQIIEVKLYIDVTLIYLWKFHFFAALETMNALLETNPIL